MNNGVRSWVKLSDFQVQVNISVMPVSLGFEQNQIKVLLRLEKNTQRHDSSKIISSEKQHVSSQIHRSSYMRSPFTFKLGSSQTVLINHSIKYDCYF